MTTVWIYNDLDTTSYCFSEGRKYFFSPWIDTFT